MIIMSLLNLRSVSFDTSFLLHEKKSVDRVIKILIQDNIPCFVTTTVLSELERLKLWGRITKDNYKHSIKRLKKTNAKIIDFKNRLFSDAFSKACILSMEEHHGVEPKDIANDCNILVSPIVLLPSGNLIIPKFIIFSIRFMVCLL